MRYIGIDVSKATFMVAYPQSKGGYKTREFKNTTKGIHEFINTLELDDHCVMEATGYYGYLLLYLLNQKNKAGPIPTKRVMPREAIRAATCEYNSRSGTPVCIISLIISVLLKC